MRTLVLLTGLFAGVLTFSACSKDDDNDDTSISTQDRNFVMLAAHSNLAEINAGGIAVVKGDNTAVKLFGSTMISDHTNAQAQLKGLSDSLSVTVPTTPDSTHIAIAQKLQTLSGYTFDSTYMSLQVGDHKTTVAALQTEIDHGNNARLRAWARKTLPVVQMHLNMADTLYVQLTHQ